MQDSVLNLGEKVVLAARLAAIEHVRQMLEEISQEHQHDEQGERRDGPGGAPAERFTDEPTPQTLQQFARTIFSGPAFTGAVLSGLVNPTYDHRVRGAA
jgi:hypothetical protein